MLLSLQQGNGLAGFYMCQSTKEDKEKGFENIKQGSNLGCCHCSFFIATLYHNGKNSYGVEEDPEMYFKYIQLSADQGSSLGQYRTALHNGTKLVMKRRRLSILQWWRNKARQKRNLIWGLDML